MKFNHCRKNRLSKYIVHIFIWAFHKIFFYWKSDIIFLPKVNGPFLIFLPGDLEISQHVVINFVFVSNGILSYLLTSLGFFYLKMFYNSFLFILGNIWFLSEVNIAKVAVVYFLVDIRTNSKDIRLIVLRLHFR